MVTLLRCQGALAGRCDAKCYNADGPECHCVCGGLNHGKGEAQGWETSAELAAKWAAAAGSPELAAGCLAVLEERRRSRSQLSMFNEPERGGHV